MEVIATQVLDDRRIRAQESAGKVDPGFQDEIAELFEEWNLAVCYQCGVCSGSCPTMDRMQDGPRKIMRMAYLGMAEAVLNSPDIWLCVSCYSCTTRCPQGVQITDVMATLRSLALARGITNDKEAAFSRVFVDVLARYGRMFEAEVLLRYDASGVSPGDLIKQAGLGLRMFRKGKIGLRPTRIEGADEVARIVEWAKEGETP